VEEFLKTFGTIEVLRSSNLDTGQKVLIIDLSLEIIKLEHARVILNATRLKDKDSIGYSSQQSGSVVDPTVQPLQNLALDKLSPIFGFKEAKKLFDSLTQKHSTVYKSQLDRNPSTSGNLGTPVTGPKRSTSKRK
jgi:hypothetical protein